ncbi:MAG: ATP-binding cassette domain-containing protein, partial [Lachnospiraceae bacterium]|nr:ATP-binding cassette domain-containing protein [Lachnospiraceae bacterium]
MTEKDKKMMANVVSPALEAAALDAGYGDHVVVAGADLKVAPGEVLTLIGPNGAGKSTIIKTIAGQLETLGGRVSYLGKDIKEMSGKERARHCAVALTGRLNPEKMTGREVVETGRYPYTGYLGLCSERDIQKADEAIRLFDAQDIADRPFEELSDGQKQRLMLARAVCQDTEILVLDEPTSYLDLRYKLEILQKIRFLATEEKRCVILSLHELDLVRQVSDLVACVKGGEVDRIGTPEEIFSGGYLVKLFDLPQGALDEKTGLIRFQGKGTSGGKNGRDQTPDDSEKNEAQEADQREIFLVGIGSGDPGDLTQRAKDVILSSDRIAGAGRMLETAKALGASDVPMLDSWRSEEIVSFFDRDASWKRGCVLLSGDVGFYSGAKKSGEALSAAGYAVKRIPGLSCLQLLAAAFRFSWDTMP